MNKKELRKAYEEKLITKEKYQEELFDIETSPKVKVRKEQRLPESLTIDEFKKLMSCVRKSNIDTKIAFLLAYGSGLRISEIVGSRDKRIKPLVKDQIKNDSIKIFGKYSKERIVPLPKGWKDWMYSHLPIIKSQRALERSFKRYALKAGLSEKYHFHDLRHSFATRSLESGVPINQVQLLMGHSDIKTTGIYTKARPEDALKSYRDLF